MLELCARFDEEKQPRMERKTRRRRRKSFSRVANKKYTQNSVSSKKRNNKTIQYGFVSTGNLNEKTKYYKIYVDHLLMTSNRAIMADINKVFNVFRKPKIDPVLALKSCNHLLVLSTFYERKKKLFGISIKKLKKQKAGRKCRNDNKSKFTF